MNLNEVNSMVFDTKCGEFLADGLSCSQPILSKGPKGIIDNFFVYTNSRKTGMVSAPKVIFGIYSERKEVAYIDRNPKIQIGEQQNEFTDEDGNLYALYERYELLYSAVRSIAFQNCSRNDAKIVTEYCATLKKISGATLWNLYNELFPAFFEWANTCAQK